MLFAFLYIKTQKGIDCWAFIVEGILSILCAAISRRTDTRQCPEASPSAGRMQPWQTEWVIKRYFRSDDTDRELISDATIGTGAKNTSPQIDRAARFVSQRYTGASIDII